MGNVCSITGCRDERTHVTGDIGSDGNGWEPRPVITELANGIVDERRSGKLIGSRLLSPELPSRFLSTPVIAVLASVDP